MVASPSQTNRPPQNVREMIAWLQRIGRPPLPECPIEAAKQGKEPKQPCFLDNKGYLKTVNWKQWQTQQPLEEIIRAWFCNPKTGIGTLGGWNGKHWLAWADFDQKDFASPEECDRRISDWEKRYSDIANAPMFRTPSGGYRFLVAFESEPQNFKANSGFSLDPDGKHHVGELLTKNGGHTLLPPTTGVSGKPYVWQRWSEYPPIFGSPEDVGLYPLGGKAMPPKDIKEKSQSKKLNTPETTLSDFLLNEVEPRLTSDIAFSWHGHDFKEEHSGKVKGCCPWHDSKSGTAFYAEQKGGSWLWRCPACDIGGGVVQYRHRLKGGNGSPEGRDFVDVVRELANDVGVAMPEFTPKSDHITQSSAKILQHPASAQPNLEALQQEILETISKGVKGAEAEAVKIALGARFPFVPPLQLVKLWDAIARDLEESNGKDDEKEELEKLLKLGEQSVSLADYLPLKLSRPLTMYCQWLNIRPEVILLALLTATSSLHEVGTELVIHQTQGFTVPPTIYSGIVAESGQKKSPITNQIITRPLAILKKEALQEFKEASQMYEVEFQEWEERKKQARQNEEKFTEYPPQEPKKPDIFYFTDGNGEGIKAQAAAAPAKAMFALVDELAGYFNSADKYRGGRGSDKQEMLSYFDTSGQTVLRSAGVKVDVARVHLSIFGTIQPEILKGIMKDSSDPDGTWSRFLYAHQPLSASELGDDDGSGVNLVDLLAGVYRRLNKTSARQYTLSREAFKLYQPHYNRLEKLRVTHPNPGMRAVYSKAEGYTGRLALNLHVLHELSTEQSSPCTEIPVERMREAIALMKFFIGQTRLLYSAFDEGTAPHLVKMISMSQRLQSAGDDGWIKAKPLQSAYNSKTRPKPNTIREWMQEAVTFGLGEVRGSANKLEFRAFHKKVDSVDFGGQKVDKKWTELKIAETPNIYSSGDSNIKKVDLVDLTPPSQGAMIFTGSVLVTPQEEVEFSGLTESTSPPNAQNTYPGDITAVDFLSTGESTSESTFLSTNNEVEKPSNNTQDSQLDNLAVPPEENVDTSDVDTSKMDVDISLKPLGFSLKAGERIKCYPSQRHFENKWAVSATIISLEAERGWFKSCTIEYCDKKKGVVSARISGGCCEWILAKCN